MPQKDPRRTEKATPRRREKAREQGNVPRSEEVSKVVAVLCGFFVLRLLISFEGKNLWDVFNKFFHFDVSNALTLKTASHILAFAFYKISLMILPVLLAIAVGSVFFIRAQVGHVFTFKVFKLDLNRFNPITGIKNRFFNLKTAVQAVISFLQMLVVGIIGYVVIKSKMDILPTIFFLNPPNIAKTILELLFYLFIFLLIPLIIISLAHLAYTRWEYEENLKMTKEEVKDEFKQLYGSPEIKREQRKRMMDVAKRRMMAEVPRADVVITNPVHIAVALRYEPLKDIAPVVVAKGKGYLAEKIKEIAKKHNIPIKEDKLLARTLYENVEVGEVIPEDLYQAVASILAQLDKFRKRYSS